MHWQMMPSTRQSVKFYLLSPGVCFASKGEYNYTAPPSSNSCSIIAYLYFELSLLPPPNIPRVLSAKSPPGRHPGNIDVQGNPHTRESKSLPLVPGTLDATCDLALILYTSMQWNAQTTVKVGSDEDVAKRRQLLGEVRQWRARTNPLLRDESNFNPTTFALRYVGDPSGYGVLTTC